MSSIDHLHLQRLVDGELNFDETQQLMREAESDPGHWREIAGAFVENQIWAAQFVDEDELAKRFLVQSQRRKALLATASPRNGLKWLALSASVFLAFTLGVLATQSAFEKNNRIGGAMLADNKANSRGDSNKATSPSETPMLTQQELPGDDLNQTPAVYRMQVKDESGNQFLDSEVPLYTGKQADAQRWLGDPEVPQDVRRRLADSGYQVRQNVRYLSGKFRDGRTFVIPVRKYSFSSGQ